MYPAPPAAPRVQFLTALSGDRDIEKSGSTLLRTLFGGPWPEFAPLRRPYGVAAHDGRLYVCDTQRRDIFVFDFRHDTFAHWPHPGVELEKPVAIRVRDSGGIDICDTGRREVLCFTGDGELTRTIGLQTLKSSGGSPSPTEFHPVGVADGPNGGLAILNAVESRVELVGSDGGYLGFWSSLGSQPGQLYRPRAMAQSGSGHLLISDPMNRRVLVLDTAGRAVAPIGEPGDQPGYIADPRGLTVDDQGVIYLTDVALQRVQMFGMDGRYLMSFGHTDDGTHMPSPAGICVDRSCLAYFDELVSPGFEAEYLIFVSNQVGPDKILVYAFGQGPAPITASSR